LVKAGCDLHKVDQDGTNSLMAAAVRGHQEIVTALLTAGSPVNAQNVDGHTALMFAFNGKNQVATLWERYEAYMEEGGEDDTEANSLIIKEALDNHTAVLELLMKRGADSGLKDKEGHTAKDFDFNPGLDEEVVEQEMKGERKRKKSKNEL